MTTVPPYDHLALTGGTIYIDPLHQPIRNGVVLIAGDKIAEAGIMERVQIPPAAQVIDCGGCTITAGFWNSHVHFMERKWADAGGIPAVEMTRQLQAMLSRYGFTSAFDLSSPWQNTKFIRDRIESGEVPGPRIYSTGVGLLPVNAGLPPETIIRFMGWMNPANEIANEVADAEQAASAARKLLDMGVDGIKLFASAPSKASLSLDTMEAAVREAHRARRPVFVHPNTGADVLTALRAGVDVIAHTTPHSGPWDETLLAVMKERHAALIPTLWIWKWYARHDRQAAQDRIVDAETGQLRAWIENGGTVLFGTDLGAVDPDPTEEYELMARAGMSFEQILDSLTTAPAERFGKSHGSGRLAAGFQADVTVLNSDPAIDLCALSAVRYTLRDGKIIYQADR